MHTMPRHQCVIYEGAPSTHLQGLALTIVGKLKAKKRCMYLNSPKVVMDMRLTLASLGVDIRKETEKRALILTSSQEHLTDGTFDVDKMIEMLGGAVNSALEDGYIGLWATGDMTWELGGDKDFGKLFEYERKLEAFMKENPALSGVCQYHRDTIPVNAIRMALHTHPAIYINDTLSRINPDYRPVAA